jgi:hypothetical protein
VAAAGIHPGALVNDKPDSPHHDAAGLRGELCFAFAEIDRTATAESVDQFRDELQRNHVRGVVERLRAYRTGSRWPTCPCMTGKRPSTTSSRSCPRGSANRAVVLAVSARVRRRDASFSPDRFPARSARRGRSSPRVVDSVQPSTRWLDTTSKTTGSARLSRQSSLLGRRLRGCLEGFR